MCEEKILEWEFILSEEFYIADSNLEFYILSFPYNWGEARTSVWELSNIYFKEEEGIKGVKAGHNKFTTLEVTWK